MEHGIRAHSDRRLSELCIRAMRVGAYATVQAILREQVRRTVLQRREVIKMTVAS